MTFKEDTRYFRTIAKCSYKCQCGRTVVIPKALDKVICPNCKKYVFRDDRKRFDYIMKGLLKNVGTQK